MESEFELTQLWETDMIVQFPKISAIYYGLLQAGYDFYIPERSAEHIRHIMKYRNRKHQDTFFFGAKQDTCDVYPYWPRASMMESASFFLNDNNTGFQDFETLRRKILTAGNISENERGEFLWSWLEGFPRAIVAVLSDNSFAGYLEWEGEWIAGQEKIYREEMHLIQECLEICTSRYHSPVRKIRICLNPVKCVYASDYHLTEDCFVFSSGAFRTDSVIHEFLHHVVHPTVAEQKDMILKHRQVNDQLDQSYYLTGSDSGVLNAFEETVVRSLTKEIMNHKFPDDLSVYIEHFLKQQ